MRNRILLTTLALIMLAGVFCLPAFSVTGENSGERYHQHLEEPGYTPCADHGNNVFCTHLPIVVIDTEGQEVPGAVTMEKDRFGETIYSKAEDGTDYINVSVAVIDNEAGNNHLTDAPELTTRSLFRIRGHASREFEKSPYLLKFVTGDGLDNDVEVMGMAAHHEWALHGPYLDKSLVRNYMWYNIAGEIMDYAPNVRYCELFVNGDYRGLYIMTETITNGGPEGGRLDLSDTIKGTQVTGYLLRVDRPSERDLFSTRDVFSFTERTGTSSGIALRYPGKNKLTPELSKKIELEFSAYEKSLWSFDHDTEQYGYWNWIDVENWATYYVFNEFCTNTDAGLFSTYIYKTPKDKLKLCVWDFNNSCNNFPVDFHTVNEFMVQDWAQYKMLFQDSEFVNGVIKRYRELRKTYLSEKYIDDYIDSTLEWLGPVVQRNYIRWKDAYDTPMLKNRDGSDRNSYTVEQAVQQLKDWTHERGTWMDDNIDALKAFSHPSRNKKWNH